MGTYCQSHRLAFGRTGHAEMATGLRLSDTTISMDIPVIGFYRFVHRNNNGQLADNPGSLGRSSEESEV